MSYDDDDDDDVLTYKMAIALRPQICDVTSPYV